MRKKYISNETLIGMWQRSLTRGTRQYVRPVEAFLAQRTSKDARDATDDELRDYILAINGRASQTKVTSALSSFYKYLHSEGVADDNPALYLRRRVLVREQDVVLQHALEKAGHDRASIRSLRWIDVIPGANRSSKISPMPKAILTALRERLVRRLNTVLSEQDLEALLSAKIFAA